MGLLRPGARVSSSRSKQLTDLDQMLKERQILLCQMLEADLNWMLEADLEVCDVILADELERGMHSSNGWNLSVELDKAHALTDRITNERTGEARRLSQHIMGISNALVDLDMLLLQGIPQLPKSAREILLVAHLILKHV
jgi:hypothetical protein